jgi:hypothetical protein
MNLRKIIREILENASNLWINGGILLIKGKDFEDGTQPLYAVHIVNLMQVDRKKKDETEGAPAKMAILGDDLYRVILDNGRLRAAKVDWKNLGSLSRTLKFNGRQSHAITLNNNKTPLHWETLKYNYFPKMFMEVGSEIMNIPNIKLTLGLSESFDTEKIWTGKEVNKHIIDITPDHSDIPDYFMSKFIAPRKFKMQEVNLKSLLETDPSFKEYFDSGEERYDYDDVNEDDLNNELVVVDGTLLDGYSRASELLRRGENTAVAFVAI